MKSYITAAALSIAALVPPASAGAQTPNMTTTTVKVQLVLTRYQGDKKVASLPYTVTVITDERNRNTGRASLRLGSQVPITTMARQNPGNADSAMVPTVQYRDVGTSVDCTVTGLEGDRYKVDLSIEDSSIDTTAGSLGNGPHPAFRSFRINDALVLKDGQSSQYLSATDRLSGDVWKVDVTLNVVK